MLCLACLKIWIDFLLYLDWKIWPISVCTEFILPFTFHVWTLFVLLRFTSLQLDENSSLFGEGSNMQKWKARQKETKRNENMKLLVIFYSLRKIEHNMCSFFLPFFRSLQFRNVHFDNIEGGKPEQKYQMDGGKKMAKKEVLSSFMLFLSFFAFPFYSFHFICIHSTAIIMSKTCTMYSE